MTWPVLTNMAVSSALTIARVILRMLMSCHLKTICPLRSSGTAMNSRPKSAISGVLLVLAPLANFQGYRPLSVSVGRSAPEVPEGLAAQTHRSQPTGPR